jgi:hypothetical protein
MNIRRTLQALIAALLTTFALVAVAQPSSATSNSFNIKGVATLDGKPISGVTAHLMQSWTEGDSYDHIHNATTSSKGYYSFSDLPYQKSGDPYAYVVIFTDSAHRIVATSRYVPSKPGETVTRNVTLKPAATITGTLSRADGTTPHNISVLLDGDPQLSDPNGEGGLDRYNDATRVHVHTNGSYEFVGVAAGTHHVQFIDDSGKYADRCYDNVNCLGAPGATDITAVGGQTVTLNPQVMTVLPNHISGTVKDAEGHALKSIRVSASPSGDGSIDTAPDVSDASGNFTIGHLPAGGWQLQIWDQSNIWETQWYDRKASQDDATVLNVGPGDVDGINITMLSRSILKATPTPGTKSATFQVLVTRKADGTRPSGSVTVNQGSKTATGDLVDGRATIKLSNLTPGKRTITVTYSGNSGTAGTSKTVVVIVK